MAEDLWKHRSKKMSCATCMWWVFKGPGEEPKEPQPAIGRCRRRAPTMAGFPATFPGDWCGEHKIDENSLKDDIPF